MARRHKSISLPVGIVSSKLNPYKSDVTKDEGRAGIFFIL